MDDLATSIARLALDREGQLLASTDRENRPAFWLTKIRGPKGNGDAFLLETAVSWARRLFFFAANGKDAAPEQRD